MIIQNDLTDTKDGRCKAEYTYKCGWIDWNHAVADRQDLVSIWSQLPHVRYGNQRALALNSTQIKQYTYYRVSFEIDQSFRQKLISLGIGAQTTYTFYVLDKGPNAESYYKQAALYIYMLGCCATETIQLTNFDFIHQSGFSMEDLVSDILAFYMHVENMDKIAIIQAAGGWTNAADAKRISQEVYGAMLKMNAEQPKCHQWFQTYLFNDIANIHPTDKRGGFQPLPTKFQQIKPLPMACFIPPAPILSKYQAEKLMT